jgi:pilus assembly protein Flp/PilA
MSKFASFLNDESGAAAAEYVLIIAVIGGLVAAGGVAFGGKLSTALTTIGTYLTTKASALS